jgi:RNA polymerase sigma-70 factor (ECF subfamily)
MTHQLEEAETSRQLHASSGADRDHVLARFIDSFQTYLRLVADRQLPEDVRAKVSPSDIIQNTYLEARRDFKRFSGNNDRELLAWLCQILLNNVKDAARHYQSREKRKVSREVPLQHVQANDCCPAATDSPSRIVSGREEEMLLQHALAKLPKEYRQVIVLRSFERRSFAEVGQALNRSEEAARKQFGRAIVQLQHMLQPSEIDTAS